MIKNFCLSLSLSLGVFFGNMLSHRIVNGRSYEQAMNIGLLAGGLTFVLCFLVYFFLDWLGIGLNKNKWSNDER